MNSIESQKVPISEKIGISLGTMGSDIVFDMVSAFLIFFYTDIFGIPAAVVGTLYLISRIFDAVNDPVMGVIADRTDTRWGKFRPYILFSAFPYVILGVLMFTTPRFGETGKIIWAYTTFLLFIIAFTALMVPYQALVAVTTQDKKERIVINSLRSFMLAAPLLIVSIATLPLVKLLGRGNESRGYMLTMTVYAFISFICFMITFFKSKERIKPIAERSTPLRLSLKNLIKNKAWVIISLMFLIVMIIIQSRVGIVVYYFTYNAGNQDLTGLFLFTGALAMIVGLFAVKYISQKIGMKNMLTIALFLLSLTSITFFFVDPRQNILIIFILNVIANLMTGWMYPAAATMMAEAADYSEWKFEDRSTGLITSTITLAQKIGASVGGASIGWALAVVGYTAGIEQQNEKVLLTIKFMISIFPAIFALIGGIVSIFYPINEKLFDKIRADLEKRRSENRGV